MVESGRSIITLARVHHSVVEVHVNVGASFL